MEDKATIEEVLEKEGFYMATTSGVSMWPMLKDRRDTIIVKPFEGRLKKYDVPLYKNDDKYILHRIIEVKDDHYVIRGDNCYSKEYVEDSKVLGVLTDYYRKNKKINMSGPIYKGYVLLWCKTYPLRLLIKKVVNKIKIS